MRFQIGQKIPVISFIVKDKNFPGAVERDTTFFFPWEEQVISSEIVYLTVTEHHRVPNYHDTSDTPTCDGYILKAATGERWFNQYPRASYGQLDDSADRMFHRENFEGHKYLHYVDLFSYMEGLLRGESQLNGKNEPDLAKQLRNLYESLKERYEELTGNTVNYKPHEYETEDGKKHILPDWFDLIVQEPQHEV